MIKYKYLIRQKLILFFLLVVTILLFLLLYISDSISFKSQKSLKDGDSEVLDFTFKTDTIYSRADENPEFIGGLEAFKIFINENLNYPVKCQEKHIEGRVLIMVVIEKDGTITNPEVIKSVDPLLDNEAIRIINILPKFKAGRQNGIPVRVSVVLPIDFRL